MLQFILRQILGFSSSSRILRRFALPQEAPRGGAVLNINCWALHYSVLYLEPWSAQARMLMTFNFQPTNQVDVQALHRTQRNGAVYKRKLH